MLRIEQARFGGRNAEEGRVEMVDFFHEPTASGGRFRLGRNVRRNVRVQAGIFPATGGGTRDRVYAAGEESFERCQVGRARHPAGHAHDRHRRRLLNLRGGRAGPSFRVLLPGVVLGRVGQPHFRRQVRGQLGDVGVVECDRGGRDVRSGQRAIDAVAQVERHERVHAQVEEPDVRSRGFGQAHDLLHLARQRFPEQSLALAGRGPQQAVRQIRTGGLTGVGHAVFARPSLAGRGRYLFQQRGLGRAARRERFPVDGRHQRERPTRTHDFVERRQRVRRAQPTYAFGSEGRGELVPLARRATNRRPGPPRDRGAAKPETPAIASQLVQPRVGGSVAGLSRDPQRARNAGKQDEFVQGQVFGGKVQVPCSQYLGRHGFSQILGRLIAESLLRREARQVVDAG